MRAALLVCASALLTGCQSYNPLAVFGPPTVPAPGSSQSQQYYPPPVAKANSPTSASSPRLSVSADDAPPPPSSKPIAAKDAADREPIRIVENPSAARTATAPSRGPAPARTPSAPSATPANPLPPAKPGNSTQSRFRADPAVAPAAYQQASAPFVVTPAHSGQWRPR